MEPTNSVDAESNDSMKVDRPLGESNNKRQNRNGQKANKSGKGKNGNASAPETENHETARKQTADAKDDNK